jgi:hypothetical protein
VKFVYKPAGADQKSWDFDPDSLPSSEAEVIEEQTGWTYVQWWAQYRNGSMKAAHALLLVLLRRDDATLQWGAVQFTIAEYDIEDDPAPKDQASEPDDASDTSS